jgi:hypothetical protein
MKESFILVVTIHPLVLMSVQATWIEESDKARALRIKNTVKMLASKSLKGNSARVDDIVQRIMQKPK